ncbi:MAG TPA: hypothetical protein VMV08_10485 [Gaiellaceae bacterium]|nr:hypothetical protein [Gaiellaceae bacterium]
MSGTTRVSTIASSIASPSKALSSGKRTLENLVIAGVLVLFITFPAQLFNHTFDENYAEIREWWKRRFGWLEELRALISGSKGERAAAGEGEDAGGGRGNTLRDTLAAALVVLTGGVLGGLLDPWPRGPRRSAHGASSCRSAASPRTATRPGRS